MIEARDILNWCFTIAILDFAVFGFLYSVYAFACLQVDVTAPILPPITKFLRYFCSATVGVLAVLTILAVVTSYTAHVNTETWIIVLCFIVLTGFSLYLLLRMH